MLSLSCALGQAENARIFPEGFTGIHSKPLVYGKHSMVVTNNVWASAAAHQILQEGGNAVDAAIAAAFVLGLTEPQSSGIGGGGFALTYNEKTKQLKAFDGREIAPHSATPDLFIDQTKHPLKLHDAMLSYKSIGVPAEVALLSGMHKMAGHLPWAKLVTPAIKLAQSGFPMSPRLYALLNQDLAQNPTALISNAVVKALYFTPQGRVKPIGTLIKNKPYAHTLSIIAQDPRAFYKGQIAEHIISKINQLAKKEVYVASDLSQYTIKDDRALCKAFRTNTLCTTPFATGGVTVLELMSIYANNYTPHNASDPMWLYHFLEASKLAYADRNQYIADPAFVKLPLNELLENQYIAERSQWVKKRALNTPVSPGHVRDTSHYAPDKSLKLPGTTSIAIVDHQGNAITMTVSVEAAFGSHVFVDGFFLNNELTDFSFISVDAQGNPIANSIAAFKRPRSAIAPMMAFNNQHQLIALTGSPGGSQIICYVSKNLIQMLDFNKNPKESSEFGNLCATNDAPVLEKDSLLVQYSPTLNRLGEQVVMKYLVSGAVNIKRASPIGWFGAADPRREGVAIGDR